MAFDSIGILAGRQRLNVLLREFDESADDVRTRVHEAIALLMGLHRRMLERVLELSADSAHHGSPSLLEAFAADPLVAPLLQIMRQRTGPAAGGGQ